MGTSVDSEYTEKVLEDIKTSCEYLAKQGIESLVITVMKDSHHLAGSEKGRSFLKEKHVFVKDFVLYCKDNGSSVTETDERFSIFPVQKETVSSKHNVGYNMDTSDFLQASEYQEVEVKVFNEDTDEYDDADDFEIDSLELDKVIKTEKRDTVPEKAIKDKDKTNNGPGSVDIKALLSGLSGNNSNKQIAEFVNSAEEKEYECIECKLVFKSLLQLTEHTEKAHIKSSDTKEGSFPCSKCGFVFCFETHLTEHNQCNPSCIFETTSEKSKKKSGNFLQHVLNIKTPNSDDEKSSSSDEVKSTENTKGPNSNDVKHAVNKKCPNADEVKKRTVQEILDVSSIKLPAPCPICARVFNGLYTYQCHILMHSQVRLVKCHICLKELNSESGRKHHYKVHEDRPYFCNICNGRFETKTRRNHHVNFSCKKTKDRPGLVCPDCGYQTKSKGHLMLHKRKHTHVTCKCDKCGKFLKSQENLDRHMWKHHQTPFKCEICGKIFKQKDTLKRHKKEHGELKFKCEVCGKFWSEVSKLNRHLKIHSGIKLFPYICEICGHAFSRRSILDSHRHLHTGETPYKCDFEGCEKAFRSVSSLKQHKEYHVSYNPFMCDFCGRSFKRECMLRHHRKSHTEFQWPCSYCSEKFNSRKRFKSHIINFHREKALEIAKEKNMAFYECKLCDKLFSQKSVYDDHVFIHKGIKPSVCSYCGKSFSNDSNKRQHEKTHTGGKTLRCNLCSKTYNDIKALKLHLENKHKQKSVPNIDSNVRTTEGHVQSEPQLTVEILSAEPVMQDGRNHQPGFVGPKMPTDFYQQGPPPHVFVGQIPPYM